MIGLSYLNQFRWHVLGFSLMSVTLSALAEVPATRYPITSEMVVSAMQYRQVQIEGVQIRLSAEMTASASNPVLDIQSMTMSDPHTAQLRLGCRVRGECQAFYVAANWPDAARSISVPAGLNHHLESPISSVKITEPPVDGKLKPGSHATLLIEGKKIHIRLQVLCLQGGITGDTVRVSTLDHKQAYKAEIVAPNLLEESF